MIQSKMVISIAQHCIRDLGQKEQGEQNPGGEDLDAHIESNQCREHHRNSKKRQLQSMSTGFFRKGLVRKEDVELGLEG